MPKNLNHPPIYFNLSPAFGASRLLTPCTAAMHFRWKLSPLNGECIYQLFKHYYVFMAYKNKMHENWAHYFWNMTLTTRKSDVIVSLAASQMTSSTQFSGVKSEFPGVFYAQNALNGRTDWSSVLLVRVPACYSLPLPPHSHRPLDPTTFLPSQPASLETFPTPSLTSQAPSPTPHLLLTPSTVQLPHSRRKRDVTSLATGM